MFYITFALINIWKQYWEMVKAKKWILPSVALWAAAQ